MRPFDAILTFRSPYAIFLLRYHPTPESGMSFSVTIDGLAKEAKAGERLIDLLNRAGAKVPQVCYHPQLGPIQTCDTCMVEADGRLVRACATVVSAGIARLDEIGPSRRRAAGGV